MNAHKLLSERCSLMIAGWLLLVAALTSCETPTATPSRPAGSTQATVPCPADDPPAVPQTAPAEKVEVTPSDLEGFAAAWAWINLDDRSLKTYVHVLPESAKVAYLPSLRISWGLATFRPSDQAPPKIRSRFNHPYDRLILVRPDGCWWNYSRIPSEPFPCPSSGDIPEPVRAAWQLKSPSLAECSQVVYRGFRR